jgi:hypothetical protein
MQSDSPDRASGTSADSEKHAAMHSEYVEHHTLSREQMEFLANFSEDQKKKVLRKVSS